VVLLVYFLTLGPIKGNSSPSSATEMGPHPEGIRNKLQRIVFDTIKSRYAPHTII
jgi:hypothetical protein